MPGLPGLGKRKGSKGQSDKDRKMDDVGDKKKTCEGISGKNEEQVPLSAGVDSFGGASVGGSPAAGDREGHHYGATPSVHDSEEPQDGIKYWEEVIRDSTMKIKVEKNKIKEAEKMKKAKKKAKEHSTSSHGHSSSSTSHEAPLSPAPSSDTARPESPVFDCDVSQEGEPERKLSSSQTVDPGLKTETLSENEEFQLAQLKEKIAKLEQEKTRLTMKCRVCEHESQAALGEKKVELPSRCKELETTKLECADLKVDDEQKCTEKSKLDDDYSQQLQEKERLNQQPIKEDESTKLIEALRKELKDTQAKDQEDAETAYVVQQGHLQQIRILQDKIEQMNSEREEETAQLRVALEEQEKCSADSQEQAERLSHELDDTKRRLDEDVKHLREEILRKDELKDKEMAELKESSDKRIEAEVRQQIRRQDAVYSERLRSLKEEVKRLTDDVENKNSAISELSEQLKSQKEIAKRDVDQQQRIRANEDEIESMRMEIQKSEQKFKSDLDSLRKQLQSSLEELKSVNCDNEELKVSLDERNKELNKATEQNATLTSEYDKLCGDYTRLSEQFKQLKVEADMKKELSEFSSSTEPCESQVHELQLQQGAHADDDNEEYHSASESSLNGQDQASNRGLTDLQNKQQTEEVEQSTKQAIQEAQRWRDSAQEMESKMKHLNKQLNEFREWQRLLVGEAKQDCVKDTDDGPTAQAPKAVNYDKYKELKKELLFLTEKITKCESRNAEMVDKLKERDEQIKELKSGTMSLPVTCESLTSSSDVDLSDKIYEDTALSEIERLKKALVDKDNHITSLQTQISSTGLTPFERNKMEMHGKQQSKTVMEWRKKFEHAEEEIKMIRAKETDLVREVRELQINLEKTKCDYEESKRDLISKEDELDILKGEVSAQKDSVDAQALHIECERRIEALKTEAVLSEISSKQRYESLEAEADSLRQQLRESERQYTRTKDKYDNVSSQLVRFNRFQDEVRALKEDAVMMSDVVAAKTAEAVDLKEEKESLQGMLKAIAEELERRKIEACTYKEDFNRERKDREDAASKHEEEKSTLQKRIDDQNEQMKILESKHRLKEEESMTLKKDMELLSVEKQSLDEAFSKLEDRFKEKEGTLEKVMAHKSDLESQLSILKEEYESKFQQITAALNAECDKLQQENTALQNEKETLSSECQDKTELNITLSKEIEAVSSDCQAKTQQVKQYRKQADTLKVQMDNMWAELQEAKTKVNEYERQLQYYQEQVRQLTEDEEQKAEVVKAQFEAELLNLNRDLDKLRKEKASLEVTHKREGHDQDLGIDKALHIQALSEQLENMKARNRQLELDHAALEEKYHQVMEKCDVQWRQVDVLKMVLQSHRIPLPTLEQPPRRSQQPPPTRHPQSLASNQTTPHQASQYNQPQMPRSQPIGQVLASQFRGADGLANVAVDGRRMVVDNGSLIESEAQPVRDHQGHQAHARSQDNALMQSINTEIHRTYAGVGREVSSQPELESLSRHAPFDPNLVCPMCRVPFRIGEIQKYRQHVKFCQGT